MTIQNIACCTDFSDNADAAFQMAAEMAEKYNATLTVIHVLPPSVNPLLSDDEWAAIPDEPRDGIITKIEKNMEEKYAAKLPESINVRVIVLDGHVSTEIIKYIEENQIDLVVVGSYGLTGMELVVFGSVAKRVAHKAPCSVLIARKRP